MSRSDTPELYDTTLVSRGRHVVYFSVAVRWPRAGRATANRTSQCSHTIVTVRLCATERRARRRRRGHCLWIQRLPCGGALAAGRLHRRGSLRLLRRARAKPQAAERVLGVQCTSRVRVRARLGPPPRTPAFRASSRCAHHSTPPRSYVCWAIFLQITLDLRDISRALSERCRDPPERDSPECEPVQPGYVEARRAVVAVLCIMGAISIVGCVVGRRLVDRMEAINGASVHAASPCRAWRVNIEAAHRLTARHGVATALNARGTVMAVGPARLVATQAPHQHPAHYNQQQQPFSQQFAPPPQQYAQQYPLQYAAPQYPQQGPPQYVPPPMYAMVPSQGQPVGPQPHASSEWEAEAAKRGQA